MSTSCSQVLTMDALVLDEPYIEFGLSQRNRDPKRGLLLFGPTKENRHPAEIRVGIVATASGLTLYKKWVERLRHFIPAGGTGAQHVLFPGFKEIFQCEWPSEPVITKPVSASDISRTIRIGDRHQAIYETVTHFADLIRQADADNDAEVDLWMVLIPDEIFQLGRPMSRVPLDERGPLSTLMNAKTARTLRDQPSLFLEDMEATIPYQFAADFHHQLKARLLDIKTVTQVVRESSLQSFINDDSEDVSRGIQDPASVAWNISTSAYFKAGGRPWKLANIRGGVCYVGLVFKQLDNASQLGNACCGAQMFLDTGDGMVFKGTPGNWGSTTRGDFHLSYQAANALAKQIVTTYAGINGGVEPSELFIHGRTWLNESEWQGICDAVSSSTTVVGVRIAKSNDHKLYRYGKLPVMRGTCLITSATSCLLWTNGYVPDLGTYPGREVPNPLEVSISRYRGRTDIQRIADDLLALTKLNFNSCIYGDGLPVTLRFAGAIGDILTSLPERNVSPLPFRHYI